MRFYDQASLCVLATLAVASTVSFGAQSYSSSQSASESAPIMLASEPHHHLALQNEYVKLYRVEVSPGDSVRLHRHDTDAISLSLSDSLVTVHSPGKPDVRQKLTNGQIRLQALGLVHSTSVEGDTQFRNVTVELLLPQQGWRNLCSPVVPTQQLNCPVVQGVGGSAGHSEEPQFETEQTKMTLVHLPPHRGVGLTDLGTPELMIVLDDGISQKGGNSAEKSLHAGDFAWIDRGGTARYFKNDTDREARFVYFVLKTEPKR